MIGMKQVRVKPHRLPAAVYFGEDVVSFTVCEDNRRAIFRSSDIVMPMLEILRAAAVKFANEIPIYCFMPDHLHVIFIGKEFRSRTDCSHLAV